MYFLRKLWVDYFLIDWNLSYIGGTDTAGLQGLISDSQVHAYYNNGYLYMYLYMCGKIHCSFCAMIKNFSDILLGGSENQYHWSPYYKKATPFAYVLHHVKDTCIYLLWGVYIWMNLKIPWRYCHKFFTLKMDQKLQVFWEKSISFLVTYSRKKTLPWQFFWIARQAVTLHVK